MNDPEPASEPKTADTGPISTVWAGSRPIFEATIAHNSNILAFRSEISARGARIARGEVLATAYAGWNVSLSVAKERIA